MQPVARLCRCLSCWSNYWCALVLACAVGTVQSSNINRSIQVESVVCLPSQAVRKAHSVLTNERPKIIAAFAPDKKVRSVQQCQLVE